MRCWRTLFLSPPSAPSHTPFSWTCWIFWRATPTTCFLKSKSSRRIFRFSMRLGAVSLFKQKSIFYTSGLSKANQYNYSINLTYNMKINQKWHRYVLDIKLNKSITLYLWLYNLWLKISLWTFVLASKKTIKQTLRVYNHIKANPLCTTNYCTIYQIDGPRLLPDESL